MKKVLVTPRSFAKTDNSPYELLEKAGFEVVKNPVGGILTKEQMCKYVADIDGIIVGVDPMDAEVLACAKNLKTISKYGVGTDNIDLNYAKQRGISVSITVGANANAVADYAFALIMACARKLIVINDMCHEKNWSKVIAGDVYEKTLGILGLGAIGKGLAKRAKGFDMKVLAYDVFWDEKFANEQNILFAKPEEIYRQCDFISLHMPLTDDTQNMIGEAEFATMKPTAILINTARGGLVDEDALIAALKSNKIAAAGFDAFSQEPPENEELYKLPNLIMGSHCGASTVGAAETMSRMAVENLIRELQG